LGPRTRAGGVHVDRSHRRLSRRAAQRRLLKRRFALPRFARYIRAAGGGRRLVRLLFVSPHYGTLGGVRVIIDRLAAAARAAGHDVGAVVDASADAFAGPASTLVLYPFPPRARDLRRLERFARKFAPAAARLAAAVRRFAPDVVSVHCVRRFAPYTALVR